MSSSKRRSRLFGPFGRKVSSQPFVTTINTVGIAAAASALDSVGPSALDSVSASAAASAASADVSRWDNSAAALRNIENASKDLDEYFNHSETSGMKIKELFAPLAHCPLAPWDQVHAFLLMRDQSRSNIDQGLQMQISLLLCFEKADGWKKLGPTPILPLKAVDWEKFHALSATRVYAKPKTRDLLPSEFEAVGEPLKIDADRLSGSVKATTVEYYAPKGDSAGSGNVLVVAIRGTANTHDWMINLNDGLGEPIADPFMGLDENGNLYSAHTGFLACAKAINAAVMDHIYKHVSTTHLDSGIILSSRPMLLFTGHSAGGAVAAMLYAHFTRYDLPSEDTSQSRILKNAFSSVNCITFGAPPITTRPLLPTRPDSLCLSIVNDGDPVPRADNQYIPCLLRLFCGPMSQTRKQFELPARVLFNAGQVVVVLTAGSMVTPSNSGIGSLADTVMGDMRAHPMKEYRKRIGLNI